VALGLGVAGLSAACSQPPGQPERPATPVPLGASSQTTEPASAAGSATAAWAIKDLGVWSRVGGGDLVAAFPARQPWGDPTAFLVRERRRDQAGKLWYRILLPRRPNGSTGWVPGEQVRLVPLTYRVEVDLGRRELRLLRLGRVVDSFQVVVGAPGTPTPTGEFFISAKLRPPRISSVYGSWALALSAYSKVLDQFGTGDGQIALHGTREVAALGRAVSHGCVRLDDRAIRTLARLLPLGSPVTIRPEPHTQSP
jgi:lipoprotein-anchoring transpeptidase ErfK/SrfK